MMTVFAWIGIAICAVAAVLALFLGVMAWTLTRHERMIDDFTGGLEDWD